MVVLVVDGGMFLLRLFFCFLILLYHFLSCVILKEMRRKVVQSVRPKLQLGAIVLIAVVGVSFFQSVALFLLARMAFAVRGLCCFSFGAFFACLLSRFERSATSF